MSTIVVGRIKSANSKVPVTVGYSNTQLPSLVVSNSENIYLFVNSTEQIMSINTSAIVYRTNIEDNSNRTFSNTAAFNSNAIFLGNTTFTTNVTFSAISSFGNGVIQQNLTSTGWINSASNTVNVGANSTRNLTPFNGYMRLPGNLLMQWGIRDGEISGSSGTHGFGFPINFSVTPYHVSVEQINSSGTYAVVVTSFTASFLSFNSAGNGAYHWVAIGPA